MLKKIIIYSIFTFLVQTAISQNFVNKVSPPNADRNVNDQFGSRVAISGNYALIGTNQEDRDANNQDSLRSAGAAYIYKKDVNNKWGFKQKLVPSDRATDDFFGGSLCIQGDFAFVGASGQDEDSAGVKFEKDAGMVYVFKRNNNDEWLEFARLTASDRKAEDDFGNSIAVSGDYLVVGALNEDEDANGNNPITNAGSVYIFKYDKLTDKWKQAQKIVASDRGVEDNFGWSVAINGDYLIVGAPLENDDVNGNNSLINAGSAYVYKKDNTGKWTFLRKILPDFRTIGSWFGASVAISSKQTIVIGAAQHKLDTSNTLSLNSAGSAYIFEPQGSNWKQVKQLVADKRETGGVFGVSVAILNDLVLIGSRSSYDENGLKSISGAGALYSFEKNKNGEWKKTKKTVASDRNGDDYFGLSIAIDKDNILVGSHFDDEDYANKNSVHNAGAAYFFNYICIQPEAPVVSAPSTSVCKGSSLKIKVTSKLNDAASWAWSTDSCGGKPIHLGDSLIINPVLKGTTYYIKATGGCSKADTCALIKVSVKSFSSSSKSFTICASDSVAVGNKYYHISGTYKDTLLAQNGCDSFVTTQLTVLPQILHNNNKEVCFGEVITIGTSTYLTTGTYYDTLKAFNGCDSIIKTQLIVKAQNIKNQNITICQSEEIIIGNSKYTATGVYSDTLKDIGGCDSIITTNLTVSSYLKAQQNIEICFGKTFSVGSSIYKQSGTYNDTLKNTLGCDSVITTKLTVLPQNKTLQSFTICKGDFVQVSNNKYTIAGTYFDTLQATNGCDSIVETEVEVNTVNTKVTVEKITLKVQAISATYQWLDCNNNYLIIAGETSNSFIAQTNGGYAVEITQNNCVDSSICIAITAVGIKKTVNETAQLKIYPNPASNEINIVGRETINKWVLKNTVGQTVLTSAKVESSEKRIDVSSISKGLYILVLYKKEGTISKYKIIIE